MIMIISYIFYISYIFSPSLGLSPGAPPDAPGSHRHSDAVCPGNLVDHSRKFPTFSTSKVIVMNNGFNSKHDSNTLW